MRFTSFFVAASAILIASAQAVLFTNSEFSGITVGVPFNITWSGATSTVTIKLKSGPSGDQIFVKNIATDVSGTFFVWTPDPTIVDGTYNLEIDSGSEINYSLQFPITGGAANSSSVASSAATSSVLSASTTTGTTGTPTTSTVTSSTSSSATSTATPTTTKAGSSTTKTGSSSTSSAPSVPTPNDAAQYASPFAFVLMAYVAIAALN